MTRYRNVGLFVVLAAVWGSAFMAIKAGLAYFPPVLFAAIRYDVAAAVMLAYVAYVSDDPLPRGRGEWGLVAVGSVLLIAGYHALLFVGEADPRVTSASAAVIVSLSPVLTTGFARLFLPDERLTAAGLAGLVLGLVGVAVINQPDPGNLLGGSTLPNLLVFGAAACFALGSVLTRRIDADLSVAEMETWSMLGGALVMHLLSAGMGESLAAVRWTPEAVLALAYLALAASAAGFLVYFDLLGRLGAIEINLVSYVAPVFAALSGWAFLGEIPTLHTVAGFVLIFAGFVLLKRGAIRQELARAGRRGMRSDGGRDADRRGRE